MSFLQKPGGLTKKTDAKLNITSMMDMFTIILVFLLFSYSIEDSKATMDPGLTLPDSTSSTPYREAVTVTLTRQALKVNKQVVLKIRRGKIPTRYVDGMKIKPLYDALMKEKDRLEAEKKKDPKKKVNDKVVLFQADKTISFKQIDPVMKTAGMAGFPNFRVAVMRVE